MRLDEIGGLKSASYLEGPLKGRKGAARRKVAFFAPPLQVSAQLVELQYRQAENVGNLDTGRCRGSNHCMLVVTTCLLIDYSRCCNAPLPGLIHMVTHTFHFKPASLVGAVTVL